MDKMFVCLINKLFLGRIIVAIMPNDWFRFKKFVIHQSKCAMKVGTDGVLLGAWANLDGVNSALDVGAGTALISLMLAQRGVRQVDAVELNREAATQAELNVRQCTFGGGIKVHSLAIQEFKPPNEYDLVISNPPYFSDSLKSQCAAKQMARHDSCLTMAELFSHANRLLEGNGKFAVILPFSVKEELLFASQSVGLFMQRVTLVYPTPNKPPKRLLAEFGYMERPCEESQLVIESNGRHQYSEEYRRLTKDFYLAF